ncbi:flagellar export chaperone FliS [Hydrogenothermus marinus]|uniref:Flagellar protein FliS n=1 Tax=Hydrogenothermus marinus TaxID=133270 RepID=A0A3M0B7X2_9AQUI|nr:flagellar export chaperone FliS [Hydrogenothermus marinus]RMA93251.1 flagellar protein FliS [Hydrogenothermus marinus]
MTNPYEQYNKYDIETLSSEDALVKAYEELLSALNVVKLAIQENDIKQKATMISKINKALSLFQASLDFEKGGEIAKNLNQIYDFCLQELLKANLNNSTENIDNIIRVLTPIYEGFKEAKEKIK